jgi:hypothetical protein
MKRAAAGNERLAADQSDYFHGNDQISSEIDTHAPASLAQALQPSDFSFI